MKAGITLHGADDLLLEVRYFHDHEPPFWVSRIYGPDMSIELIHNRRPGWVDGIPQDPEKSGTCAYYGPVRLLDATFPTPPATAVPF